MDSTNLKHSFNIDLTSACALTANYRKSAPAGAINAELFSKEAVQEILDQRACVGLRIYYGLDDNGVQHLVLVGTDTEGEDLYNGQLREMGIPCPPDCSTDSPLNSD